MRFVVGLGNPGREYVGTRHNLGFEVVDELARRHGYPAFRRFKNADVSRGEIAGQQVLLVKPLTYMNLSGDAVGAILGFYKGEASDVVAVHDELDFEPGVVRLKQGGGHGGNNGVRSLCSHIGRDFARVRLGIGKPRGNGADHVLSRFTASERIAVDRAVEVAADAVEAILAEGMPRAMSRFNQRAGDGSGDEGQRPHRAKD